MNDDDFPYFPLLNEQDLEILMHRDAHFGGNFGIMIEYYEQKGIGVMPDFEVDRIKQLQLQEEAMASNLSDTLMPVPAKETVDRVKKMYRDLRSIYETKQGTSIPHLISDLILAEDEDPVDEIGKLVGQGKQASEPLIHLISTDVFYDPLYPGYGRAPILAAKALAQIQDETAIPYLFSAIGQENFFTDEEIIKALLSFGEKAKEFLLSKLMAKPFSKENERAIIALLPLEDDPEVASYALQWLLDPETYQHEAFVNYLIFACSGLIHQKEREQFVALLNQAYMNSKLKAEMQVVINHWK